MAEQKKKPIKEMRIGAVKVAIWANDTQQGVMYQATVERLYKPQGSEWKSSRSFGRDDLLTAAKLLDKAHTFIANQEDRDREAGTRRRGDNRNGSGYADQEGGYSA